MTHAPVKTAWGLWPVVAILLVQFLLRAHHITELPFFWDENRHIMRAAAILEGRHPAEDSNGKFLLYMWIAPFHPRRAVALHVSRTAIALFSLIGTSALFATARRLFGKYPALVAVLFYTFTPFALFYERMVLADSLAAALGTLTAWQSVRLAVRPTYRRAVLVGTMAALAVMAKLTMTFSVVLMPVLAGLLLAGQTPHITSPHRGRRWIIRQSRCYWWYWVVAGVTFVALWLPTLIPAAISGMNGKDYVLVDQSLIDESVLSAQDVNRWHEFQRQLVTLLSWPMVAAVALAVLLGLWKKPRPTLFILLWLALIWIPSLILVWRTQTRYLMPGMYPVALLLAGGTNALAKIRIEKPLARLRRVPILATGIGIFLVAWIGIFALPFAVKASSNVAALDMTRWDNRDYFQAPWNAYGLLPALSYLDENGETAADGTVHVLGIGWMCAYMDLYTFTQIKLACVEKEYDGTPGSSQWQIVVNQATHTQPLYVVLEQHRKTLEIPEIPFAADELEWVKLAAFQRPKQGLWVTVWQVFDRAE